MKPTLQYDARRQVGRIRFASGHVTQVLGSRAFAEKVLEGFEREAETTYQRALASGRDETDAAKARDRMLTEGLIGRAHG